MGSKQKYAHLIASAIQRRHPTARLVADLFCGGFAMSEFWLKKGHFIIANDANKYVIALLHKILFEDGTNDFLFTSFVDKATFCDIVRDNSANYPDWLVGYVMCCWSFGNNQKDYLYGQEIESLKRAGHEIVINCNPELLLKFISIPSAWIDKLLALSTWQKRRIAFLRIIRALQNRQLELQQLERLGQLQYLENLGRLGHLELLERLENKNRLQLYSMDYRQIEIPKGAVVYCDPPYAGTAEYKEGAFNHAAFWEWVRVQSKSNPVYISEYSAPPDFKKVLSFERCSTLSSNSNNTKARECLFTKA